MAIRLADPSILVYCGLMAIKLGFYRHFKGMPYRVRGIARHSETMEELVLYETLYKNSRGRTWVRPLEMFKETVSHEGKVMPRFQPIAFTIQTSISPTDSRLMAFVRTIFPTLDCLRYEAKLRETENHLCLVALDGEHIVGFKLGYSRPGTYCSWLGGVDPEYRGLGVGSLLLETMKDWCRARGYPQIDTKTMNQFPEMIRLNLKYGFDVIGTEDQPDGELKILMRCDLTKTVPVLPPTSQKGM